MSSEQIGEIRLFSPIFSAKLIRSAVPPARAFRSVNPHIVYLTKWKKKNMKEIWIFGS